jgi:hypothetical protein
MSFTIGFKNPTLDIKSNFVANYGSYAEPYDALDSMGYQKFNTQWPYLVAVLCLILMIISFSFGEQQVEKTTGKKILNGLGWLFLLCTLFGIGYGIYLYFAVYMPQYTKWFDSLPSQAKASVGMMTTLDKLTSSTRNRQGTAIHFN